MYDCYNEAIQYLKEKLGVTTYTKTVWKDRKLVNVSETRYRLDKIVPYSDEHSIHLLLTQYYYGIAAKKELFNKLIDLGVIKDE